MRLAVLTCFLTSAIVMIADSHLTFKTESKEFSILISSSSHPIDTAIDHINRIQDVTDRSKSIKAQRRIMKSHTKAKNIKAKFIQMAGSPIPKHRTRSIFDSITDTTGLVIGKIFGLASSKQTRQLSTSIKEIRLENEHIFHSFNTISKNQRNSFLALNLTIKSLETFTSKTNAAYHDLNQLNRILNAISGDLSTQM